MDEEYIIFHEFIADIFEELYKVDTEKALLFINAIMEYGFLGKY